MAHFKPYSKDSRAQRRIQGEDVFGNKINVLTPSLRTYSGRKVKLGDQQNYQSNQDYTPQNQNGYQQNPRKRYEDRGFQRINSMEQNYDQSWDRSRYSDKLKNLDHLATPNLQRGYKVSGGSSENSDENSSRNSIQTETKQAVDLVITNLDTTIDSQDLKRLLTEMFKKFAMIISINIVLQADGAPLANIRVSSQQEAQFAISQLHRQKLGHKRIVISYAQSNGSDPEQLRAMVIGTLQEVPDKCLPLFKFIELLESKYHCTVSVSEINKLKDVCKISDELGSRLIFLTKNFKSDTPPSVTRTISPYCTIHCPNGVQRGWADLNVIQTSYVMMPLKSFSSKLNGLLGLHLGSMPLLSFQYCYELEYKEQFPIDPNGVALEHLVTCVSNIEITVAGPNKNIKIIKQEANPTVIDEESVFKAIPPALAPNINLLCRELVDLLKTTEKCQLPLTKFIPAYHHHFGRQCRVADYGYTKLVDLFESIPHVIQILGDGTRKTLTLSHAAQVRRFTSDLLRVLKVQTLKQINITEFPSAYERVMNKMFNAVEYGLCSFKDLLGEVPENTVVVSRSFEDILISLPKREQTVEEIVKTRQFANEVVDLLRHSPYFTILFNKFVPAYHHHFGHQCKVSDYGFTKLIELFEAIPDIVTVNEMSDRERYVTLTFQQTLKVLGFQIVTLIKSSETLSIPLTELRAAYLREFGFVLEPSVWEFNSILQLVEKLSDYIQVIVPDNAGSLMVVARNLDNYSTINNVKLWSLLIHPPYCKDLNTFKYEYDLKYNFNLTLNDLQQFTNAVKVSTSHKTKYISLTAQYILASQIYHVLYNSGGSLLFFNLQNVLTQYYGNNVTFNLSDFNIYTLDDLLKHFGFLINVQGNLKNIISLHKSLADHMIPLPPAMFAQRSFAPEVGQNGSQGQWTPCQDSKKVSPPKPDTPPSPGTTLAWNLWETPNKPTNNVTFSINMPISHNPKLLGDPKSFYSPAKSLLSYSGSPWALIPSINAPDVTELPLPDKLISKNDSTDSGVISRLENSSSDTEMEHERPSLSKPAWATALNFNH